MSELELKPFFHEGFYLMDGQKLHLVCNFRAIDVIESVTGESMTNILPQLVKPPHSLAIKLLWGLLREKHEGVTLDEAASIAMDPKHGPALGIIMADVISRAFGIGENDEKKEKGKNPPRQRGRSRATAKSG